MNNRTKILHQIAYRGLSSIASLVTITSNIEETIKEDKSKYFTDVIFLTFKKSTRAKGKTTYSKQDEISAKLDSITLRALSYGLKNSVKRILANSTENKETSSSLYSDRTATTEFFINFSNEKIFFNIKDLTSNDKRFIGIEIDAFKLLSLADSFTLIADMTEKYLYSFQRNSKATI